MRRFRKFTHGKPGYSTSQRPLEHWYRDRTVYFITASCRSHYHAFRSEGAKAIFWDRFNHYTKEFGFIPWVTSLMSKHYHTLGYLEIGDNLGKMMQRLHGSVAKLVNDVLPERRLPFWRETGSRDYFDGCLRDELQCRRAYRYTLTQSVRHGLTRQWQSYPHTHVQIDLERGIKRALEINAFMTGVSYRRYQT